MTPSPNREEEECLRSMPSLKEIMMQDGSHDTNHMSNASSRFLNALEMGNVHHQDDDDGDNDDDNDDDIDSSMSEYEESEGNASADNLQNRAAKETRLNLARRETKAVKFLKYVVLMVLFLTALGISLATYFYARSVEQDSFRADFDSVAVVTIRSFAEAVEHRLTAMDAVAVGVTSHAVASASPFPNVTIPDWEVKAATLRTQTGSIYVFWLPFVTDETRAGYEAYTQTHQQHILEGYMTEEGLRQFQDAQFGLGLSNEETQTEEQGEQSDDSSTRRQLHAAGMDVHPTIHSGIWGLQGATTGEWIEEEGQGLYVPVWQMSPVVPSPSLTNYNFLDYTDLAPMILHTKEAGKATLSHLQTRHIGSDTEGIIRVMMTLNQFRHDGIDYQELDPLTQVAYPVFDSFHPLEKKVAGLIITTIFWRLLFSNVLSENVRGVICVLSNTLGEQATYRIDGRVGIYLGEGDLHDPQYDDMVVTRDFAEYIAQRANIRDTSYTAVPLDGAYSSYQIHVYPSGDFEETYQTSEPLIYAVVIASIFIFTCLVFLGYDWLVEYRQRKVMDKAVKSTAVVTSLFPEAVHDRLFDNDNNTNKRKKKNRNNMSDEMSAQEAWKAASDEFRTSVQSLSSPTTAHDIVALRSSRRRESKALAGLRSVHKKKGRPIADKFPNVTVLFADLAGFTQWSSTREPDEVFVLLEALYGGFDKIALRRQVFKVETIGDCYMACTGLPNPQPDHALRMCKFARDCQFRMSRILNDLADALGDDTRDLEMRIGINSGPVTAGVLRGDKGRFQLFGDTVNTASRMESNGVKGRIHVSESTAALLSSKLLTERADRIHAKGKGEMRTFFVTMSGGGRDSIGRSSQGDHVGSSSCDASHESTEFDETIGGSKLSPEYLEGLGMSTHLPDTERAVSFDDEAEQTPSFVGARRQPLLRSVIPQPVPGHGRTVAQRLGITEEIEL